MNNSSNSNCNIYGILVVGRLCLVVMLTMLLAIGVLLPATVQAADPEADPPWSQEYTVSDDVYMYAVPAIAVDNSGIMHVVWQNVDNDIVYSRRSESGEWSASVNMSNSEKAISKLPDIDVDADGILYVVWQEDNNIWYASGTDGIVWEKEQVTSSDLSNYSSIAVDNNGTKYVVWQESIIDESDTNILFKSRTSLQTWAEVPTHNVSGTNYLTEGVERSLVPQIGIDSNQTVHIVWEEYLWGGDHTPIFYRSRDSSDVWTSPQLVNNAKESDSSNPTLAVDGGGAIHVAWQEEWQDGRYTNADDIYYRSKAADEQWADASSELRVYDSSLESYEPEITVDGQGSLHLVWREYAVDGDDEILYSNKSMGAGEWSLPVIVTEDVVGECQMPAIATGSVHIVYVNDLSLAAINASVYVPDAPTNTTPSDGAFVTSLTPTLTSSAFSDADALDMQSAARWQITTTPGDYTNPVWDSGVDAQNLTSIDIPASTLSAGVTYYWHVQHADSGPGQFWSDYSTETSFQADGDLPAVTVVALAPDPTDDNTPSFNGTATDSATAISSVEYLVNGGSWTAANFTADPSDAKTGAYTLTLAALADGSYTIQIRATDAAGNTTSSYASDSFVVDTTVPEVILDEWEEGATTSDTTPSFTGSITDATSTIVSIEYRVDGGNWQAADFSLDSGDPTSADYFFSTFVLDGEHLIEVRATDASGNVVETSFPSSTISVESGGSMVWLVVLVILVLLIGAAVAVYFLVIRKSDTAASEA